MRIIRIVSDLRDIIVDSKTVFLYEYEKPLSLSGFARVWFTSLHVRAVMPVMSAKQPGIFPHACVST